MNKTINVWRVLAITLAAVLILLGIAWQQGLFQLVRAYGPANSLMVISPYRHAGTWVFDDPSVGLRQEPFVAGIPEMIDAMVRDIPNAEKGFRLIFSTRPFPGCTQKLVWRRGDRSGNWYYSEQFHKEGWLCPGLFKYYRHAPKEIYAKAEKK